MSDWNDVGTHGATEHYMTQWENMCAHSAKQAAEITRLRAALVKYGQHDKSCIYRVRHNDKEKTECPCGYLQALEGPGDGL